MSGGICRSPKGGSAAPRRVRKSLHRSTTEGSAGPDWFIPCRETLSTSSSPGCRGRKSAKDPVKPPSPQTQGGREKPGAAGQHRLSSWTLNLLLTQGIPMTPRCPQRSHRQPQVPDAVAAVPWPGRPGGTRAPAPQRRGAGQSSRPLSGLNLD